MGLPERSVSTLLALMVKVTKMRPEPPFEHVPLLPFLHCSVDGSMLKQMSGWKVEKVLIPVSAKESVITRSVKFTGVPLEESVTMASVRNQPRWPTGLLSMMSVVVSAAVTEIGVKFDSLRGSAEGDSRPVSSTNR